MALRRGANLDTADPDTAGFEDTGFEAIGLVAFTCCGDGDFPLRWVRVLGEVSVFAPSPGFREASVFGEVPLFGEVLGPSKPTSRISCEAPLR